MQTWIADARYGFRILTASPGFALAAILTLALGIGANAAVFSVISAVLLRPLPWAEPDGLVRVYESDATATAYATVSPANYIDWREQVRALEGIAAFQERSAAFDGSGGPERLRYGAVAAELFELLRARPALGRTFRAEDDLPGAAPVVVVSDGFWRRRLSADPDAVGGTVKLDGKVHTVVGVMPASFWFPSPDVEYWAPIAIDPATQNRGGHFLSVLGRFAPDATLASARAEMAGIAARLATQYPSSNADTSATVRPLHDAWVGSSRSTLLLLWGAAGFVVLIACANVANLMLTRTNARSRELAIRAALGAGRWRLTRQLITENLIVAGIGAGAGLIAASWGTLPLLALGRSYLPSGATVAIDARVLGLTLLLALGTAVALGFLSAWHAWTSDPGGTLKERGQTGASSGGRASGVLVVAETALAIVLLIGAGLLLRTLDGLNRVDPGFRPDGVLTASVALPEASYADDTARSAFWIALLERLEAEPGLQSTGATNMLPLAGNYWWSFERIGAPADPENDAIAQYRSVTPGYFRTMGIPLVLGRDIEPRDRAGAPYVLVINQAFADLFFPGTNPVGQTLRVHNGVEEPFEVVGVVGNVRHVGLDAGEQPFFYVAAQQVPFPNMTLVARGGGEPRELVAAVRTHVAAVDPSLPLYRVRTMPEIVAGSVTDRRFATWLLGSFAAVALLLSAVGVYGVLAYAVSRRTGEFGIRMALGATPGNILRLVMGQGMRLSAAGTVLGLAGAWAATRFLERLLFGIRGTDPLTFAAIPLLLIAVSLAACWIPARRATRITPLTAIRDR